eukprot:COSAG04_NODE_10962_length_741_cov_0.630841_2_plen_76_part_00
MKTDRRLPRQAWGKRKLGYRLTPDPGVLCVAGRPEHDTGQVRYTQCFDEIHKAVRKARNTIDLLVHRLYNNLYVY